MDTPTTGIVAQTVAELRNRDEPIPADHLATTAIMHALAAKGFRIVGPDRRAVDAICRRFARATANLWGLDGPESDDFFRDSLELHEAQSAVLALDPAQLED